MKYWVFIKGEEKPRHYLFTLEKLKQVSWFTPELMVCPETVPQPIRADFQPAIRFVELRTLFPKDTLLPPLPQTHLIGKTTPDKSLSDDELLNTFENTIRDLSNQNHTSEKELTTHQESKWSKALPSKELSTKEKMTLLEELMSDRYKSQLDSEFQNISSNNKMTPEMVKQSFGHIISKRFFFKKNLIEKMKIEKIENIGTFIVKTKTLEIGERTYTKTTKIKTISMPTNRPLAPKDFRKLKYEFYLESSKKIITCTKCGGVGSWTRTCGRCNGSGQFHKIS